MTDNEFAKAIDLCEKLDFFGCADYLTDDLPDIIDNLVKEMTEEQQ